MVATKRSRREDKQMAKEKMQEDKVTKKLSKAVEKQKEQQAGEQVLVKDTSVLTEGDGEHTTSFENT